MDRLGLVSAYSFLYGVHKPEKLIERAASYGIKAVSICDADNLYGLHSFIETAKERNIRPVIGASLTLNKSGFSAKSGAHEAPSLYCFAENREGFAKLCETLTLVKKEAEKFNIVSHFSQNPHSSRGLVLACSGEDTLRALCGKVKRLYAAVTPDNLGGVSAGKNLNIPPAFLDSSVFLDKQDYQVHRVLRAIGLNKTTGSLSASDTAPEAGGILKTDSALSSFFASWTEAVKGTREISETCQFNEVFDGFIFPSYGENPAQELRQRVYTGAVSRYGELGDMETDRIEYELEIIEKRGFAPYFLIIDDIVQMACDMFGKQQTCGRGSGAASVVSYSLGITNVDPIAHNLYFERFMNPIRPDPPDIDIDFAWDERDELIKSVIEKNDSARCARVANHNFFRSRSALRETAKAYGFSDAVITQLERKIFNFREKEENIDPLWMEIYRIAARIEGLPRGLGMHCGGIVITPKAVSGYAPVEKSLEGYPLLAWEKEGAEASGFVKIDLLGNRSLAVIRDAKKNIREGTGISEEDLDWRLSRAINDQDTIDALACGNSIGVFYIESPAMRQLQKKTNAGDFDHIVIHSSIIRPAANKFIREYVKRLKGAKWKPLHPRLEGILNETYGILCYQEDVSKTAVALAGFDEASADKLRKIIAKKAGAAKLKVYQDQFYDGCRKKGVDEKTINEIWAMMLSFDGYSFCKPHSASYAMVSFQSAYIRVHYPAEFIAAVLSNQGGFYRPHAYISEARRMRLLIEGPDVNISLWRYYGVSGNYRGTVVIGFMAIKGLSTVAAEAIMEERERGGNFSSLKDFSKRVKLSRDDITALCPAGVFDSISEGLARPVQARLLLASCDISGRQALSSELFSDIHSSIHSHVRLPVKINDDDTLWEEYNALGFLRNSHPLVLWKEEIKLIKNRIKALHIADHTGRDVTMVGWSVTQKDVWTKDGDTMCFLSLEDETALYETVVFPDVYALYSKLLFDQKPLLVTGKVTNDQGAVSLEIKTIAVIEMLCDIAVKTAIKNRSLPPGILNAV